MKFKKNLSTILLCTVSAVSFADSSNSNAPVRLINKNNSTDKQFKSALNPDPLVWEATIFNDSSNTIIIRELANYKFDTKELSNDKYILIAPYSKHNYQAYEEKFGDEHYHTAYFSISKKNNNGTEEQTAKLIFGNREAVRSTVALQLEVNHGVGSICVIDSYFHTEIDIHYIDEKNMWMKQFNYGKLCSSDYQ